MRDVFPLFGEQTPEEFLAREERLAGLGIQSPAGIRADIAILNQLKSEGLPIRMRRHRRYAGGDGLLPRRCYASVCRDAMGDDEGTLNRELFAYVDYRLPGTVYVGDLTSDEMKTFFADSIIIRPGYCATYVLLIAPENAQQRSIFNAVYEDVLAESGGSDHPVRAFALETRVEECAIDNVFDLRLPPSQAWFFEHFKQGDGHFLTKPPGSVKEFYDLLPTLLHPQLGGSEVTHALGSWMRSSGVNALIFPSARSNAGIHLRKSQLVGWQGWNFLDYRSSGELPATEVTKSSGGWPDFVQTGGRVGVAQDGEWAGSWQVMGLQQRYDRLREEIKLAISQGLRTADGLAGERLARLSVSEQRLGDPPDVGPSSWSQSSRRRVMSAEEDFWKETFQKVEQGGREGVARFLSVCDLIYNRKGGQGIEEWIDVGFGKLPDKDKKYLLELLIRPYVSKS